MTVLDIHCSLQGLGRFHSRGWNLPRGPWYHLCGRNRLTVNQAAYRSHTYSQPPSGLIECKSDCRGTGRVIVRQLVVAA